MSDPNDQNAAFFAGNERYATRVARLATYRNIDRAVTEAVRGIDELLDVGNGGVFDYDTSVVGHITAVDLFLDEAAPPALPTNVTARGGDAVALDEPDARYDGVLLVSVLHHLVGDDAGAVERNTARAIAEAHRVLRPGGRFVLMESCVPAWFYRFELRAYRPLAAFSRTPLMRHPPTLQLTIEHVAELVGKRMELERVESIPIGRLILQFGLRWPTALTPARPYLVVARKKASVSASAAGVPIS